MELRTARFALLATATLLAACSKPEGSQADTSAMAAAAPADTTTKAAPALTDANIAYMLDQANAADSTRGMLAETKGTSADVKSFGKLMVGEHHALRAEGQALVKKLGVTPVAPPGSQAEAQASAELDSLNAMPKGAAWDKAYIAYEVSYHQALGDVAAKALAAAQNADLKALITKAQPVIQHHLTSAEEVQKKLGA